MKWLPKVIRGLLVSIKLRKIQKSVEKTQDLMMHKSEAIKNYNQRLFNKRKELHQRVNSLYKQIDSEELMQLYLIYFSAIGAKMVEPAHEWLNRWGIGFDQLGFKEIGFHLREHATDEIGHDQWHRNDVKYLVAHYNKKYNTNIIVDEVLAQGNAACVQAYISAFKLTIEPAAEYKSLGMLYETELMTFTLAPKFIGHCVQELGLDIMRGLSFLRGHIVADVSHVKENALQLHEVINAQPSEKVLSEVVSLGKKTIDVYIEYFEQAMVLATKSYNQRHEYLKTA